ncbi:MAG: GNAT family protein [Eubacteriales bacterium]
MDNTKYRKVFSALPELTTERLILKKIVPENAGDMYSYASLGEVTKYLLWSPHLNLAETKGYIEYLQREYKRGNYADWGITYKENGAFIGTIGFANLDTNNNWGEIGYVLNPDYHGKGIMTEAVKVILKVGFAYLGLHRIQARIMEGNDASVRLVERLGFRKEGVFRDHIYVKGSYRTIIVYSMLYDDFFAAN